MGRKNPFGSLFGRKKSLFPKPLSFGTKCKRSAARLTGIPTTKSGQKRKASNFFWKLLGG